MCGFSRFHYTPEANFLFICSDYFLTTFHNFYFVKRKVQDIHKPASDACHKFFYPFGCRMVSVLDPTEIRLQNKITSIWQNICGADIKLTCISEYPDR